MSKKLFESFKSFLGHLGRIISGIVSFILLAIVYFTGIGSISVVMRLFGEHFLDIKKQKKESNWQEHKVEKQSLEHYYKTF